MHLREFVGLALDPVRLSVLGRAAEGTLEVASIADNLSVSERTVLTALGKLRRAGLVTDDDRLDESMLRSIAVDLPTEPLIAPEFAGDLWSREEGAVLSRFFEGGRLVSVPSHLGKRRLVLECLAQEFDPGVRYSEPEVNFRMQMYHADYAMLRRYLVDEDMMTRADGVYWRTGGRYPQ